MAERERLDQVLVTRGFFETRARAQMAIEAGLVTVDGLAARKASQAVLASAVLTAEQPHPYVSRGGVKLAAALDHFSIDPAGAICLDIGASTGGFSDCLLQRGAALVVAVDVGTAQLHARLKGHPRMISLEQTDIRQVALAEAQRPALVVVDVSFIGLRDVLPAATALAAANAQLIALIKPQFEAGKKALKKGILRDESLYPQVIADIELALTGLGWSVRDTIASPIDGGDGNREFLVAAARSSDVL
jgi:23S rRNA (cytidine1920-2'-O)/16S rRNA (cytidine1409-2'-O)-methyltransferase